jgi:hypothetical protein
LPWDISLYVPLVVLMLIKGFDSHQMETYLAEHVVAGVFIGRSHDAKAQIRDHSNHGFQIRIVFMLFLP